MSNEVVLESAGTLHGQMQRGLGRAARRAADKPGAGEYVYDCVRRDPRWDWQCESRSLYYARLVMDLELPTGPVAEALFDATDPDGRDVELPLAVLGDLVRLSRREAAKVLHRYAVEGFHWFDGVLELVGLQDPALALGLDRLVVARCDDAELDVLAADQGNPVIAVWADHQPRIAEALERRKPVGWGRRPSGSSAERPVRSEDELLVQARAATGEAMSAIFELGRRRSPILLDLAEEFMPQRTGTRWGSVMWRALDGYGPEALPRARAWVMQQGACSSLGVHILAEHGTRQDIPLLMRELETTLDNRAWRTAAEPVEGLGRLRAGEAVPLLKRAWTETDYSLLRQWVLGALTRTAPHTAESFTMEGLWDCEEGVREIAAERAPVTRESRVRLQRLQQDAAEDTDVRASAATRFMG